MQSAGEPPVVLVLHCHRGVYPLRVALEDHLFSWRRYSRYPCVYVNVAYGFPHALVIRLTMAAVVFHTSFLAMRWSRKLFIERTTKVKRAFKNRIVPKVAVPQDEFVNTDLLDDFLADVQTSLVLTCAKESEWRKIYPRALKTGCRFRTVLTGYLDEGTVCRITSKLAQAKRTIDIGYRAWRAEAWLGSWGRHKVTVAEVVGKAAALRQMKTDISFDNSDTLVGDDWYDFLMKCKATIGVAGGASLLDRTGSLRERVNAYVEVHPGATFEEVRAACFAEEDGKLDLACISPRHLEACLTKTAQVLVESNYNDILRPYDHYFPLRDDYSNIEEALDFLSDDEAVAKMVERAYEDVVARGAATYKKFMKQFDQEIAATTPTNTPPTLVSKLTAVGLERWSRLCWVVMRIEAEGKRDYAAKRHTWKAALVLLGYILIGLRRRFARIRNQRFRSPVS